MTENKEKNQEKENLALTIFKTVTDGAVKGFANVTGAEQLALEYLNSKKYKNKEEVVNDLIKWEATKSFGFGFITGLGGAITLPVSIPASLMASWMVQARLCASIAYIYGHDIEEDKVKTAIMLTIMGDAGKEILKDIGVNVAKDVSMQIIKNVTPKLIKEINKAIGFRIMTKATQKTFMSGLVRFVPVVGGIVGGSVDAATCNTVGALAKKYFGEDVEIKW